MRGEGRRLDRDVDLERMRRLCETQTWSPDDLDWSLSPRPMSRPDEEAIVQYFTDMAGIELLAGELFKLQRERTDDPTLRAIFESFVADEERHSEVALRLARHYDVHQYRVYRRNPHLVAFHGAFVGAMHHLSPEIGNAYITGGELVLDIALLRSLDDFVDDEMSHRAMALINRDESRHIAIDFYMTAYYASDEYAVRRAQEPARDLAHRVEGWLAIARLVRHASPFFREVFFEPMELVDPSGTRIREALKRSQLLSRRPEIRERPFHRLMNALYDLGETRFGKRALPLLARVTGVPEDFVRHLFSPEEQSRAAAMTIEEAAREALAAKAT